MTNHLATARNPSCEIKHQPAHCIYVFIPLYCRQESAGFGLEILDLEAGIHVDDTRPLAHKFWTPVFIVLVFDLADDLLNEVLDRHQPVYATEFIDHQRHVQPLNAHLKQQLQNRHRRRNE